MPSSQLCKSFYQAFLESGCFCPRRIYANAREVYGGAGQWRVNGSFTTSSTAAVVLWVFIPETKGKSSEKIEELIEKARVSDVRTKETGRTERDMKEGLDGRASLMSQLHRADLRFMNVT